MISVIWLISVVCEQLTDPTIPVIKKGIELYLKYKEIINYLIVGVLTTVVSIISYAVLRFIIPNYIICTVLSWIVAVLFAYITNRVFVFNSKDKKIMKEFIKFISCRLITLVTEVLIMFIAVDLLKINDLISKIVVQFVIIILNYILSKLIVFKNK